jgi:hypothetical protein
MPFDATTFRQTSRVVHLPPQPPEREGGGPRRIHIQIEITDRRAQQARRSRGGGVKFVLLWILPRNTVRQPRPCAAHELATAREHSGKRPARSSPGVPDVAHPTCSSAFAAASAAFQLRQVDASAPGNGVIDRWRRSG